MIPRQNLPGLLVGLEDADDAGVFQLTSDIAVVQTVDYFPPIVDDPYIYGQVAAVNSLSDVYAMGGVPKTALSIVGFPSKGLDFSILGRIMEGGLNKLDEAGVILLGGHSVRDDEIKFGYAVTGVIEPTNIKRNNGARRFPGSPDQASRNRTRDNRNQTWQGFARTHRSSSHLDAATESPRRRNLP